MRIILFFIGLLMVTATLLPFIPRDDWWIRGSDFPRLQISSIIIVVLAVYPLFIDSFGFADQILLLALTLCLLYQFYMIYPYTFLAQHQVQASENTDNNSSFSILCANVQMDNRRSDKLKQIIRQTQPDIILALEVDQWWIDELEEFESTHPHLVKNPQENTYGMALYSKLELVDPKIRFLVQDDVPSIQGRVKLPTEETIAIHCLHPRPPFPSGNDKSTERDAELLIVGREIKDVDAPTVVLGDLNDVAWSKTNYLFQDISGLIDPRIGRGFYNSFHAKYPFIRFPLDHFFHSNHFRVIDFKRLDYFGSDHFPVYIELSFEPEARIPQEEKEANEKEEQQAEEKIEKKA